VNNIGQTLDEGVYLWQVVIYDAEGVAHQHQEQIHLVK